MSAYRMQPLLQTQLLLCRISIQEVLENISATPWELDTDLPLLLTKQGDGVKICISRIPQLNRSGPDRWMFARSCELLIEHLTMQARVYRHKNERTSESKYSAVIGLNAGSEGHHFNKPTPPILRSIIRERLPTSIPHWLSPSTIPATICVLHRHRIYLEPAVRCQVVRNEDTLLKLLHLCRQWKQDQISVEDPLTQTIATFDLLKKNSALSTPWL